MKLFEIVNERFFNVLTGPNKQQCLDCLEMLYNLCLSEAVAYGVDQDIVLGKFSTYFFDKTDEDYSDIINDDDNPSTDIIADAIEFANAEDKPLRLAKSMLRKLKRTGWVEEEIQRNGVMKINMPKHSVELLKTLVMISEKREIEYQGNFSTIYSLFISINTDERLRIRPYSQVILPAYRSTIDLFESLKSLNTDIKTYIEKMEETKTFEDVVRHIGDYQDNIGSKSYQRMYKNDNVRYFYQTIYSGLEDFLDDNELTQNALNDLKNNHDFKDDAEAKSELIGKIHAMLDKLEQYEELTGSIRRRHNKYLNSALNKLKITTQCTSNLEGKLISMLRRLTEEEITEDEKELTINRIFSVCSRGIVAPSSLFDPQDAVKRKQNTLKTLSAIRERPKDLPKGESALEKLARSQLAVHSIENMNLFAEKILRGRDRIAASEVEGINTENDVIFLFALKFFRTSPYRKFEIENTDDYVIMQGWKFLNFEIIKRRTGNGR